MQHRYSVKLREKFARVQLVYCSKTEAVSTYNHCLGLEEIPNNKTQAKYVSKDSPGMRVCRHKCSDIATEITTTLQSALSKKLYAADHHILVCHWQHGTKLVSHRE